MELCQVIILILDLIILGIDLYVMYELFKED